MRAVRLKMKSREQELELLELLCARISFASDIVQYRLSATDKSTNALKPDEIRIEVSGAFSAEAARQHSLEAWTYLARNWPESLLAKAPATAPRPGDGVVRKSPSVRHVAHLLVPI
ncbi:MAG: hypothetical protein LM577_02140 [Thermoproteaceae archaeon]|nr:hypothetical protein [Thermoproteaceae archaeon]